MMRRNRWLLLLPWLLLLVTSFRGLNFGRHWDGRVHLMALRRTVDTGVPLSRFYNYPGVPYLVCLSAFLPDMVWARLTTGSSDEYRERLHRKLRDIALALRLRAIFASLASLAVPGVALWVLLAGRSLWEGLLASCALALSFEFAYHLRYVAPDGINTMLTAWTMAFLVGALRTGRTRRLYAAALLGGAAFATKYQLGLLLLPVILTAYLMRPAWAGRFRLARFSTYLFFGLFLVLTPAVLLDSRLFFNQIVWQQAIYGSAHHSLPGGTLWPYRIAPGCSHLAAQLDYLGFVFFSPLPWLAAGLFLLAVAGCIALLAERPREALLLLLFPATYLAYMSLQRLMLVRNLLPLAPFLAVFAARGAGCLMRRVRLLRWPLLLFLLAAVVFNGWYLVMAGESIHDRPSDRATVALAKYMKARPNSRFVLSKRVLAALARRFRERPPNAVAAGLSDGGVAVFFLREGLGPNEWPGNRRGTFRSFGPYDVNLDYYPSWSGPDRIVMMPLARAKELGVRPFS